MRHQYQSKTLATGQNSLFDGSVSKNQNRLLASVMTFTCMVLMTIPGFSQNVNVNPGAGSYPTLKAAFDAINSGTHTGAITVDIVANTTETLSAVLNASGSGMASYTSILIQPAGGAAITVSGNLPVAHLIDLNGADNVTINGLNTGGNSLTISNTGVGTGSAIRFIADATTNIIQNCTIQGSTTSQTSGVVVFSTGTTTGNDGNNINNCNITAAGTNLPINCIYSSGLSASVDNSGNVLNQNNISDYFNATLVSQGINLAATGNTSWTITNNRLFQTANRVLTTATNLNGILIGTGSGYTISGNIIGYANSSGTGTTNLLGITSGTLGGTFPSAYTLGSASLNSIRYIAINCTFSVGGTVSDIQNNTLAGFALLTSSGAGTNTGIWCGINVNAGNANIGTTTGNIIGSTSGNGSVYTATSSAGGAIVGIYITSTNTVNIQNNAMGALDAMATTNVLSGAFTGIDIGGTTGIFTINNNLIGNASANNIRTGNLVTGTDLSNVGTTFQSTTGTASPMVGIRSVATGNSITINGNTLRGWATSCTAGAALTGISTSGTMTGSTPSVTVNGNFLGTASRDWMTYTVANAGALSGISVTNTVATTYSIQSNDFRGITYSVAGTGTHTYITLSGATAANAIATVASNTFTNLNVNTTGAITFITHTYTIAATGQMIINNNSIVTAFTKPAASGNIILTTTNGSSVTGSVNNYTNNNFSNITLSGTSTLTGFNNTDGGTGSTKTISGNTFNNWTAGTGAITAMTFSYWNGVSSLSSNTITNLTGQGAITAVSMGSTANNATSITVASNTINNLSSTGAGGNVTGITCSNTSSGITFTSNVINGLSSTGTSATITGLAIIGASSPTISKNKIYDLSGNQTGTIVNGINVTSGTTLAIYNNLIGDLRATAATGLNAINGINASATATYTVSFNTIYLNASSSSVTTFGNSCITFSSTATSLNSRNNILINLSTPAQNGSNVAANGIAACLRRSSGTNGTVPANYSTSSNNNLYWVNPAAGTNNHLTYVEGTGTITNPMNTVALFKAFLANRDQLSVAENPTFLSTTGSSSNFLHIDPTVPTQIESGAVPIGGITDDYDGDVRNVSTPDIGADEGTFILADLTGPSISYTPLGNSCNTSAVTLNASISDASGVPTAGIGLPVLYWKINAGAYTAATGVFVSGSTYQFTFGSGVVAADVVSYYIVAQDNAGTPNVSVFPAGGASGFSINPPAVSTPPTTPNAYTILTTLSGAYTVGSGGNYATLTAAIADYNTKCISGAVIFNLTDATYSSSETFPIVINLNPASSVSNTLTIKPATGVAATITGTSGATASGLIKLNGAKYVTFDGINTGGSSLTIENTSTTAGTTVFWLASNGAGLGATNNSIANCSIKAGVAQNASTTTTYGVVIAGAALHGTPSSVTAGADNDNNTIQGNTFTKVRYGIYTMGGATTNANLGTVISNNIIGPSAFGADEIGRGGIIVREEDGIQITGNEIRFVGGNFANTSAGADRSGITFGTDAGWTPTSVFVKNAVISKNKIHDVVDERTFSASAIAIGAVDGSNATNNLIANNMIYNILANGTISDQTVGIGINAANGDKVVFNTIYLTGDTDPNAGASTPSVSNFGISFSSTNVTNPIIKDNIVYMDMTSSSAPALKNACINIPSAYAWGTGSSNYNNVYILPANAQSNIGCVGGSGGTFYLTLALWQAAVTQDANSINIGPVFTSGTDLHLVPASNSGINDLGNPVSGVTTDIDGDIRNVTTPDMGADEFVTSSCTDAVAGTASASPAGPFCASGSTTITAVGYSTGAGSTYLWQKSVDLAFTSPIDIGTPSTVYSNLNTGTISSTTYFRLKVTCTSGMAVDYTLVPVTVMINPSVASVTGPSSKCQNDPAVMLTESGGTGTSWLWSTTETTQAITVNPSMTTIYSVTVTSPGGCTAVASKTLTVITAPPAPTVTPATPQSFCLGNGQALTAASTGGAPVAILSNDFNSTTPGTVTSGNLPVGWTGSSLTPGVRIWGVVATAQGGSTLGGGNFLYCESDTYTAFQTRSQVTTPAFDASNYSAVMIKFKQYYNDLNAGAASDSARVYISNDGGANFTQIQAYDTDQGTAFSGPGSVNASIPAGIALTSNMKVKLIYNSDAGGNDWYWAIDDFVVEGIPNPIYSWTATPALGSGLPGGAGTPAASNASIIATPTIEGVYTYTAVATGEGCASLPGTTASVTATSIEVANGNDSGAGSLRDIIACAGPGVTITFSPSLTGTTILLTGGEIAINKNLTIAGLGAVNLTVSGNNASRIFHVLAGNTLTLQGMTLKDATAVTDGGAVWAEGNLTLDNVVLQNNFENGTEKSLSVTTPAILQIIGNVDMLKN